jgi:hypothetical protein
MTGPARVALVTCEEIPDLDPDDAVLVPLLKKMGVDAEVAIWDDPSVDWNSFNLAVIRSAWDYARRRDEFVEWAKSVPRLANPASVVEWNTDKHYLAELEDVGVPVVHTMWLEPEDTLSGPRLHTRFPALGDFVIKPAVSAGSLDSGRYTANSAYARGLALKHARRLLENGRSVMIQRYVSSVDSAGENSLVFIDNRFAYAAHREAMLSGPDNPDALPTDPDEPYRAERMDAHEASPEELELARTALNLAAKIIPGFGKERDPLLYARVDVVAGEDGPEVLELELTEPSLYMGLARGGPELVARAIADRVKHRM